MVRSTVVENENEGASCLFITHKFGEVGGRVVVCFSLEGVSEVGCLATKMPPLFSEWEGAII